jgi:hypothetical protein
MVQRTNKAHQNHTIREAELTLPLSIGGTQSVSMRNLPNVYVYVFHYI